MNYQAEDYILSFLARRESQEDVQKLKRWLTDDPAHRDELKQWLVTWDAAGMVHVTKKLDPCKAYQRLFFVFNKLV